MSNHIPFVSLSDAVKEYCLASFNDRRKYYINFMVHAKHIYKELCLRHLDISIVNKYVKVDKTTNPWSIVVPPDMKKFLNLSNEGKDGGLVSFVFDDTINDVPVPTGINSCKSCNESDDYGQCVNNITAVTKDVVIDGDTYTETIWKKLCPNGDILEIRDIPTIDYNESDEQVVVTSRQERIIANLELKPCGCVKKTDRNKACIQTVCGVLINNQVTVSNPTLNRVGTKAGRIKISQGRIWIAGRVPDYLILSYQTNGICGEDQIMVPEIALSALLFGMKWRSIALATSFPPLIIREAKIAYESELEKLDMDLNPIRVEEFMNVQGAFHKWGSEIDQSYMRSSCWSDCPDIAALEGCQGMSPSDIEALISKYSNEVTLVTNFEQLDNGRRMYIQGSPVMQALIIHNLGYNPVVNSTYLEGGAVDGLVSYPIDNVSVLVKYSSPVAVKIFLS